MRKELSQNKLKLEIKMFLAAKVIGSIKAFYNNNVGNMSSLWCGWMILKII